MRLTIHRSASSSLRLSLVANILYTAIWGMGGGRHIHVVDTQAIWGSTCVHVVDDEREERGRRRGGRGERKGEGRMEDTQKGASVHVLASFPGLSKRIYTCRSLCMFIAIMYMKNQVDQSKKAYCRQLFRA